MFSRDLKKIESYRKKDDEDVRSKFSMLKRTKKNFANKVITSNIFCWKIKWSVLVSILIFFLIVGSIVFCYNKDINNNHASDNQGNL